MDTMRLRRNLLFWKTTQNIVDNIIKSYGDIDVWYRQYRREGEPVEEMNWFLTSDYIISMCISKTTVETVLYPKRNARVMSKRYEIDNAEAGVSILSSVSLSINNDEYLTLDGPKEKENIEQYELMISKIEAIIDTKHKPHN